ncbi:MAG TPA: hypothetical protein VII43_10390, partial [Opitutaceae bacterium]
MNRSTLGNIVRICALASAALSCAVARAEYPVAARGDVVDDYFGEKVADPYRWMEDIDSPQTAAWVAAERACTAAEFTKIPERGAIRSRLRELWNFPKFGLPIKRGPLMFYTRNDGLQNQPVLFVVDGASGSPRALIDPNTLSRDGTVAVTVISPTDDGKLLGYGLATAGSDWNEFHVRDVASGRDLPDVIHWVKFSKLSWTHDGAGFYYCRFPEAAKGDKLFNRLSGRQCFYHRLGTEQSADRLVYEMRDHPDWIFETGVTDDGRYLIVEIEQNGKTQTAVSYADLGDPNSPRIDAPVVPLLDKFDAEYSVVGNSGPVLYVSTTLDAPKGRVVAIDLGSPAVSAWKTAVPQSEDSIEEVVLAGGKFVVSTLHDVQSRLSLFAVDGSALGQVALPGIGAVAG